MLCFVDVGWHLLEAPRLRYLVDELGVYCQVAEGCGIVFEVCCRSTGEVVVVGWTEEEDAFPSITGQTGSFNDGGNPIRTR